MTRFTLDALNPRMREQAAQKLGMTYGEVIVSPVPLKFAEKRGKTQKMGAMSNVEFFRRCQWGEAVPEVIESRNKYGAVRVETADGKFDSKKEYRDYMDLRALETAGEIKDLRRQVRFSLFGQGGEHIGTYTADFVFMRDGKRVVADSKGHKTREWKRTRKLMLACHNVEVLEL